MKIKTSLIQRELYKFSKNHNTKYMLDCKPNHNFISESPEFLIREQKIYKALDPFKTQQAFKDSESQRALKQAKQKYGKISVTKVVQEFFNNPHAKLMRMMQNARINCYDDTLVDNYLHKVLMASRRQEIPAKIKKRLS